MGKMPVSTTTAPITPCKKGHSPRPRPEKPQPGVPPAPWRETVHKGQCAPNEQQQVPRKNEQEPPILWFLPQSPHAVNRPNGTVPEAKGRCPWPAPGSGRFSGLPPLQTGKGLSRKKPGPAHPASPAGVFSAVLGRRGTAHEDAKSAKGRENVRSDGFMLLCFGTLLPLAPLWPAPRRQN